MKLGRYVLATTLMLGAPETAAAFTSPPGNFSVLTRDAGGAFTRRLKNGTDIAYDPDGFQTAITDRNGNATAYAYDGQDRLMTITDPVGKVTTFAYGGDGKLDSITDPASRVTSFEHDTDGNLTKIIDPDLSEREFAYDAAHRLTSQTSKRDFVTAYTYDFAGRFAQSNLPDGSDRQLTAAQTVGLVDTSGGNGGSGSPAPVVRPDDVKAGFTVGAVPS